jgi:DNA replication protein DnaC
VSRPATKLSQRIERRVLTSGLLERKTLEAFDWDFQPGIDKSLVLELGRLDFVRRRDDLVVTGQAGTGKSHILKAFALRACEQGLPMRYARCVDLLDDIGGTRGRVRAEPRRARRPGTPAARGTPR